MEFRGDGNGQREPTNELRIESTGDARASYEITVTREFEYGEKANPLGADYPDDISGRTASGSVAERGVDNYYFSGEIDGLEVDGPAEVYVNGMEVDSETVGAARLILPPDWQHTTRTRAGVR